MNLRSSPLSRAYSPRRILSMASLRWRVIDPDDLRPRCSRPPQLLRHILFLQRLDRLPVQRGLPGHIPDRLDPAPAPHPEGKPLRVEGIVGETLQTLLLHFPTAPTIKPGGPPHRARRDDLRRKGPAPGASCGRKTSDALGRRPRNAFLPPALQSEHQGVRISKNPGNPAFNPEAGKPVYVPQVFDFSHEGCISHSFAETNGANSYRKKTCRNLSTYFTHSVGRRPRKHKRNGEQNSPIRRLFFRNDRARNEGLPVEKGRLTTGCQ